jgi:hypothetical protein
VTNFQRIDKDQEIERCIFRCNDDDDDDLLIKFEPTREFNFEEG